MKTRRLLSKILAIIMLAAIALTVSPGKPFAQDPLKEEKQADAQSSGGAALSSGLIRLLPGQSLRVAAVNVGDKEIPLQLYIIPVSGQGKAGIPIQCNATPAAGDAAIETFSIPDGTSNMFLYVQVRVRDDPNDINELVPSVEVFDTQGPGGGPHYLLSGADFAEFRPIFVPS